ncbi:MAG: hypothetical protein B7Y76_11195, partial [Sphingobacteriia bacterium 35-40-5]
MGSKNYQKVKYNFNLTIIHLLMKVQFCQIWFLPFSFLGLLLFLNNPLHAQRLFLLAGQSNAGGLGDSALSNQHLTNRAFEYDVLVDQIKPLRDPAGQNWKSLESVRGRGTILPSFTKTFSLLQQEDVIVVHAARSGSSCSVKAELDNYGTWDSSGKLIWSAIEKTSKAVLASKVNLSGIIWMQGERDANGIHAGKLTALEYKAALIWVINAFREKFGKTTPFFIVQTGYQSGREQNGNDAVRLMQETVSKELDNVFIVYTETNLFFERGWMRDFVHYSQQGLND